MSKWIPETTPNFTIPEMSCNCGMCGGLHDMQQEHMINLENLRADLGGHPMSVSKGGGFRCPLHPDEINKKKPGSHSQGTGTDIVNRKGSKRRFFILKYAFVNGMVGIGVANSFVHLDSGHLYFSRPGLWKYS